MRRVETRLIGALLLLGSLCPMGMENALLAQAARRRGVAREARLSSPSEETSARFRALVERQARAWETRDFAAAGADWLPGGELISPGGRVPASGLKDAIEGYARYFRDLKVTVTRTFVSADGSKAAIEWDWEVTRKRDGARGLTHDAILVDLVDGKIASWREYFNLAASVDANP